MTTEIKKEVVWCNFFGPELMTNGGMESWASATDLQDWTEALIGGTVNQEATIVHGGNYSVNFHTTNIDFLSQITQFNIPLTPGKRYRLSFWHRADASTNLHWAFYDQEPPVHIQLDNDGTWKSDGEALSISSTTDWQQFSVDFICHPSYSSYELIIGKVLSIGTGEDRYVDDVSIREI